MSISLALGILHIVVYGSNHLTVKSIAMNSGRLAPRRNFPSLKHLYLFIARFPSLWRCNISHFSLHATTLHCYYDRVYLQFLLLLRARKFAMIIAAFLLLYSMLPIFSVYNSSDGVKLSFHLFPRPLLQSSIVYKVPSSWEPTFILLNKAALLCH